MTMRPNPPRLDDGCEDELNYENLEYPPLWLILAILGVGSVGILGKYFGWW